MTPEVEDAEAIKDISFHEQLIEDLQPEDIGTSISGEEWERQRLQKAAQKTQQKKSKKTHQKRKRSAHSSAQ